MSELEARPPGTNVTRFVVIPGTAPLLKALEALGSLSRDWQMANMAQAAEKYLPAKSYLNRKALPEERRKSFHIVPTTSNEGA